MPEVILRLLSPIRGRLRPVVIAFVHLFLFAMSGYCAFLLRFDFGIPSWQLSHFYYALAIWLAVKSVVFIGFKVNRGTWRYVSLPDGITLLYANVTGSIASGILIRLIAPPGFPRSIYLSDLVLCLLFTAGVRVLGRAAFEAVCAKKPSGDDRAFIYGAGAAGVMLLREARLNPNINYTVCGFIDDDETKTGSSVQGIPVLGTGENLPQLAERYRVRHVLIAIPTASGPQMVKILGYCASANLHFRTVPALSEVMCAPGATTPIREVAVEDLLGRAEVCLEDHKIQEKFQQQVILVTGAAGSIGSEICRQIARFKPRLILGFDASETSLFYLDRELRQRFPEVSFEPIIGNILSAGRVREIFEAHDISTVFHAAAYKHVPMMEANIFEAVENNVIGTHVVATLAGRYQVDDFVMISSDKAVRPTSIMGLTKHIAELLISSLPNGRTKYTSVRFGNVLGSNGSVVEIFRQQIAAGGPITITHQEMRRYFMTIPEAAQLVLQASTMSKGGEIFVLDMGQQMKIVDLARNMILLSGRRSEDIPIQFTGIRPGEKLYEELSTLDEETMPTHHEKIRVFAGTRARIPHADTWIKEVQKMCAARDMHLILRFKEIAADYNPSSQVLELLMNQAKPRKSLVVAAETAKVAGMSA